MKVKTTKIAGLFEEPIPILAIVSQAGYAYAFNILWVFTLERCGVRFQKKKYFIYVERRVLQGLRATIYVADYEKHRRLHISVILNVLALFGSYATGYAIVTSELIFFSNFEKDIFHFLIFQEF